MPRVPRIRRTMFPEQMWEVTPKQNRFFFTDEIPGNGQRMSLVAARTRAANKAALNRMFNNGISKAVPVQGPELPLDIENRRQLLRGTREAYEDALANERGRQVYNRRVAAWNSYRDLPPMERAFIANQNRLRETLYDYMPSWEANQYARNYPNYEAMPPVKMMPDDKRTLDLDELNGFESFDEFPDNGWVDMPWNRWK